jgi:hypothetical protein
MQFYSFYSHFYFITSSYSHQQFLNRHPQSITDIHASHVDYDLWVATRCSIVMDTNVSEENITPIFRLEVAPKTEALRSSEMLLN